MNYKVFFIGMFIATAAYGMNIQDEEKPSIAHAARTISLGKWLIYIIPKTSGEKRNEQEYKTKARQEEVVPLFKKVEKK